MPEPVESVDPPQCPCGGLIRPNVVWFGEALPEDAWQRSVAAVNAADVVIVVGTSSIVYPAAGLPEMALANGTAVVEVNPERTPLSDAATVSLRESAAGALPNLLQRLPQLLR
jgi:NAD-dependent deacetylase